MILTTARMIRPPTISLLRRMTVPKPPIKKGVTHSQPPKASRKMCKITLSFIALILLQKLLFSKPLGRHANPAKKRNG